MVNVFPAKHCVKYIVVSIFSALLVCQTSTSHSKKIEYVECGKEWINLHKNNSNLIGVYISQTPDNVDDAKIYANSHPFAITYLFKDGSKHVVRYSPIGQVQSGRWYSKGKKMNYGELIKDLRPNIECVWWKKK